MQAMSYFVLVNFGLDQGVKSVSVIDPTTAPLQTSRLWAPRGKLRVEFERTIEADWVLA